MTDDALAPFIRAYRDENPGTGLDTRAIRRGVLLGFQLRQRRRLFAVRFVLPIAATFFGSVALAASQGALPRWREVSVWLGVEASEPAPQPPETPRRARAIRKANASPPERAVPPPEPSEPSEPSEPPAVAPEASVSFDELPAETPRPSAPPVRRSDPLKADLAAYERAHRLHFHGGDPAQALGAWDAYLASYAAGTFAPEARFNRAISLLRLGRRGEAKGVLVSIAESRSAVYGRQRARALLDAME